MAASLRASLGLACLLVACVGDSTSVPDASTDAAADAGGNDATIDATIDAPAESGGADAGDAGCGTAPFAQLTANCTQTSCLHSSQITCEANTSTCETGGGKALVCGTVGDCGGSACCLATSVTVKPGCPTVATIGSLTSAATSCSVNTSKACPTNQLQVCVTDAECFSGTCQDTVFSFNSNQTIHFGTCR